MSKTIWSIDRAGLLEDVKFWFDETKRRVHGPFAQKFRNLLDDLYDDVADEITDAGTFISIPEPPKCDHKWRDFDWYLRYSTSNRKVNYEIIEPYVCIHCGERKNITLEHGSRALDDGETCDDVEKELFQEYPKLRNNAIVEDEINDSILVDRDYLRIADVMRGNAEIDKKIELK